jgi:hypothetical protein
MYLYVRNTRSVARGGRYGMWIFGIAMLGVQSIVFFGPPPPSDKAAAIMALVAYGAFAGVAYWLERKRA